ncbi:Carboxypeptidase A4 [Portunus trituberculatus]|uniref:tubulin-glutamate carboxypeptidase n=1 Tax=Portunus trituberculatus TaxID=210409 RepID=A0A5B7CYJ1_PORTR|nr:Carboxypeptidase A4 [Portunus trituberculatus]
MAWTWHRWLVVAVVVVARTAGNPSPQPDNNYQVLAGQQIEYYLKSLAESSERVELVSIGKSVQGRDIWRVHIRPYGDTGEDVRRNAVWFEAGIHAREWISPATACHLLDYLVADKSLTNNLDVYMVPVANPDGYEFSRTNDRYWRKNRRTNTGSSCRGVDLNRNWDESFGVGASSNPCSEVYKGTEAFSEPETEALSTEMQRVSSVDDLRLMISLHSYGQVLLYPWGYTTDKAPKTRMMKSAGRRFARGAKTSYNTKYTVENSATGMYYASGTTDDWAKAALEVPLSYTLELRDRGGNGFTLPANQILPTSTECRGKGSTSDNQLRDKRVYGTDIPTTASTIITCHDRPMEKWLRFSVYETSTAMTTTDMTAKQQLLEAVEGHQAASFLSLIQGHEKKRKTVDLEEVVLELSRGEVKHVWGCLQAWTDDQVTAFVAEHDTHNEETTASDTNNKDQESTNRYNEKLLEGIVKFTYIYISAFKDATTFIPGKMMEMTLLLHEMLTVFKSSVKLAIVSLCEQWWLQKLEAHDLVITNVLPHMLEAATRKGAQTIEEECIQDLMYTAIHANPMSSRPSANLHHLLHHIHSYKNHRAASSLITDLYQPILWRSFTVANGYVRMNATGLLCDAFPLNNYNLSQEEQSDLLEKQYHTLKTLLLDPCHLVRITAVKGLTLLLGSADAVPFLIQVLPRLGDVFDDANHRVREAFAKLLLKVKESQALKFLITCVIIITSSSCFSDGTVSSKTSILSKDFETSKVLAGADEEKEGEEEESEEDEVSPLDNLDVLCGILDTVGILWATNAHRLAKPENNKYLEALRNKLSRNYQHFFKYFKGNADASQTLLYIASFLPKSLVPTLVGHCMSQLKMVQVEQVVSERRHSRRQVRFCETSTPKPQVALHILCHILEHPINRVSMLQRHRAHLLDIVQDLNKIKDLITERLLHNEELSDLCCDTFLCECWSLYLRLVVVCHHSPPKEPPGKQSNVQETESLLFDSPACVLECLEWATSTLVPYLGEKNGGKRKLQDTEEAFTIITTLLKSLVTSSTNLLIIGAANIPFVYMLNDFLKILIETDSNGLFWEEGLCLAQESYEFLWVYESREEERDETLITGCQLANICISSMSDYFKHHDQLPQVLVTAAYPHYTVTV